MSMFYVDTWSRKYEKVKENSIEDSTLKQSSNNTDASYLSNSTSTNFMNVEKCFSAWMFTSGTKRGNSKYVQH